MRGCEQEATTRRADLRFAWGARSLSSMSCCTDDRCDSSTGAGDIDLLRKPAIAAMSEVNSLYFREVDDDPGHL
jgi:hypothetical protein